MAKTTWKKLQLEHLDKADDYAINMKFEINSLRKEIDSIYNCLEDGRRDLSIAVMFTDVANRLRGLQVMAQRMGDYSDIAKRIDQVIYESKTT